MIRFVIEKYIHNGYAHGYATLTKENGEARTFSSLEAAVQWLRENDKSLKEASLKEISKTYNIKPYIV